MAFGSKPENLNRPYVLYECRAFHNDIQLGLKKNTARLLSFISGFEPPYLPLPLRVYESICYNGNERQGGLRELWNRVFT